MKKKPDKANDITSIESAESVGSLKRDAILGPKIYLMYFTP
jgi:hypothetical protein